MSRVFRASGAALCGLLVMAIALAGILSAAFTFTESASIAVAWALLISSSACKTLSWKNFLKACAKTCKTTDVVLLLIGISSAFGYFIAPCKVPQLTGKLMKLVSSQPWFIFLMINMLLLSLIFTPIFMAIAMQFDMDPIQSGIVMLISCALGPNTPLVGAAQFVGCAIDGISVGQVMRSILPFSSALGLCLLLATYFPAFSLRLPSLYK